MKIHPCLPFQRGNVQISKASFKNVLPHVLENGCKWRNLPTRFGNWSAVYAGFRSGVPDRLFATLPVSTAFAGGEK